MEQYLDTFEEISPDASELLGQYAYLNIFVDVDHIKNKII